jgi:hypothetical protein
MAMLNPPLSYPSFMVAREAPDNESLRLELQEAILTVRQWSSLLIQMAGFITTADVVLISYGFAQRLAGILLLASTLPIILLCILFRVIAMLSPLASLVLRIERRLLIRKDSLGATFAYASIQPSGIVFGDIEKLDDDKVRELNLSHSTWQWLRRPIPIIICVATAVQLGLFVLALVVFHYRFM